MEHHLTLLFETHATSVDNEAGLASGWYDAPLSQRGEQQARELGMRHSTEDFAAVCSSDLIRAVRTAEIAFADRSLPIVRDRRLRECDYGTLTRHPSSEIESRRASHVTAPFPGGESYRDVAERVSAWLSELTKQFTGGTVLVVGHRATFYALEYRLRGVPLHTAVTSPWRWQPGWRYRAAD